MPDHHATAPDRTLFWAMLALLVWIPLPLGSNRPWAWGLAEAWVFALAIGWVVLYLRGRVRFTTAFKNSWPALVPLTLWLILVLLQMAPLPGAMVQNLSTLSFDAWTQAASTGATPILSVDPSATGIDLLQSASYTLLFALTLLLVNSERRIRLLLGTLVVSGLFQAVYGGLMTMSGVEMHFFAEKTAYRELATGTFVNRNHYANYLVLCLSAGIGLLIADLKDGTRTTWRQKLRDWAGLLLGNKARLRIALAIMVIALVLTHSRMGNTSFFAALMIASVIALIFRKHAPRAMVVLVASLIIIDVAIVGTWFGVEEVIERLKGTDVELHIQPNSTTAPGSNGDSAPDSQLDNRIVFLAKESRDEVNRDVLQMRQGSEWLGIGAGSFTRAYRSEQSDDVRGYYKHAHNDYFEFLLETGYVGTLLLGLAALISLGAAISAQKKRRSGLSRGLAFGSGMALVAVAIHASVEFNLQIPSNASTIAVLLACAWIARYRATRQVTPD